jgi:signal transduction histidine kinase
MHSLFLLSRKRILFLYFAIFILVIIGVNIGTRIVNNYYRDEIIEQENVEFMEMFFHMMSYSDEETAIESAIHFSHINNTTYRILKNGDLFIESTTTPSDFKSYYNLVNGDEYVFEIDNSNNTSTIIRENEVFIINIIVFTALSLVALYYIYSRRQREVRTVHDIKLIQKLLENHEECNHQFKFHEFHQIYHDVLQNLNTIDLLMEKRIDNLNALIHDLKTPLTILKHHLQEDENITKNKQAIISSLNDLTTIASDLIAEKFHGVHIKINASKLISNEIEKYIQTFRTKNIKLDIDIALNLYIKFNKRDLIRVLQNILTNAYYYSYDDSVVTISLQKQENYVKLLITNIGDKMDKMQIAYIFNKDTSTRQDKQKNGLGLHVTKLLLEDANANITVSSDDSGNHFHINFPSLD